jgi:hypothetical protein
MRAAHCGSAATRFPQGEKSPLRFSARENQLSVARRVALNVNGVSAGGDRMALSTAARYDHTEGTVAKTIEDQTAKLPSDTFLWAAGASIAASAAFQFMGNRHASVFVGQWAPTLLILGLYNKLVKQLGSDFTDRRAVK